MRKTSRAVAALLAVAAVVVDAVRTAVAEEERRGDGEEMPSLEATLTEYAAGRATAEQRFQAAAQSGLARRHQAVSFSSLLSSRSRRTISPARPR